MLARRAFGDVSIGQRSTRAGGPLQSGIERAVVDEELLVDSCWRNCGSRMRGWAQCEAAENQDLELP